MKTNMENSSGKNNNSTTAEVNAVIGSMYLPSCKLLKWDDNGMCYFCQRDGNIISHMDGYTGLCNGCKDKRVKVPEPERKQYSFSDREVELIKTALQTLVECREEELRWANGDPDITECSEDDISDIEMIYERLYGL